MAFTICQPQPSLSLSSASSQDPRIHCQYPDAIFFLSSAGCSETKFGEILPFKFYIVSVSHFLMTWKWMSKIRREKIDKEVIEVWKTVIQKVPTTFTLIRLWGLKLSNGNGVQCLKWIRDKFCKGIRKGEYFHKDW